ncbi:MAG TPA: hypothetical protein PKY76_10730, partial [Bacteroidales bacterium]|nr:hypothetical protein [Bacteroidales bacterium]
QVRFFAFRCKICVQNVGFVSIPVRNVSQSGWTTGLFLIKIESHADKGRFTETLLESHSYASERIIVKPYHCHYSYGHFTLAHQRYLNS